jgi:general secretion pathway protein C
MLTATWSAAHLVAAITALAPANDQSRPELPPSVNPSTAPTCNDVELKIVTESSDADFSLATLVTTSSPYPLLRRAGDGVGSLELVFVGYNAKRQSPAAWFRGGGSTCQALLFEPPPRKAPVAEAPTPEVALPPRLRLRVVPELENGSVVGVRLFGIKKDGWLGLLGLENGDRIDKVNGFELGSPERALQAYARLRTASHLRVELVRRGRPMTIDYVIR